MELANPILAAGRGENKNEKHFLPGQVASSVPRPRTIATRLPEGKRGPIGQSTTQKGKCVIRMVPIKQKWAIVTNYFLRCLRTQTRIEEITLKNRVWGFIFFAEESRIATYVCFYFLFFLKLQNFFLFYFLNVRSI